MARFLVFLVALAAARQPRRDAVLHEDLAALDRALDLEMKMLSAPDGLPDGADHDLEMQAVKTMFSDMQAYGKKVLAAAKTIIDKNPFFTKKAKAATEKAEAAFKMLKTAIEGIYEYIKTRGLNVQSALMYIRDEFILPHEKVMMEFIQNQLSDQNQISEVAPTVAELERWEAEDAQSLERLEGDELDLYLERRMYWKGGCIKLVITISGAAFVGAAKYIEGGVCFAWILDKRVNKVKPRVKAVLGTGVGPIIGGKLGGGMSAGFAVGIGVPNHCADDWDGCLGGGTELDPSQMIMFEAHVSMGPVGEEFAGFVETEKGWPVHHFLHAGAHGRKKGMSGVWAGINMLGAEFLQNVGFEAVPLGQTMRFLAFYTTSAYPPGDLLDQYDKFRNKVVREGAPAKRKANLEGTSWLLPKVVREGALTNALADYAAAEIKERGMTHTFDCSYFKYCKGCVGSYTRLLYGRKGKKRGKYPCRWWAASNAEGTCSMWKKELTRDYTAASAKVEEGQEHKVVLFEKEYCPDEVGHGHDEHEVGHGGHEVGHGHEDDHGHD